MNTMFEYKSKLVDRFDSGRNFFELRYFFELMCIDIFFIFLIVLFTITMVNIKTAQILLFFLATASLAQEPLQGDVSAVYDLIDRVLPAGATNHFHLALGDCVNIDPPCFSLEDTDDGNLLVTATSASELSAGVGWYLRHFANMTIGWPRGGGSNVFLPKEWPLIGKEPLRKRRIAPWSYLMNVCTHSYSLVWYDHSNWEKFIDWMSLSGINLMLALTGQEEIQYKVFSKLGLSDLDIRSWFNGPALLTWSRGQNEYGNNICGPLPRSWMKKQWDLQKNFILPRLRSLGITGQLPGFQGNVPYQLQALYNNSNMTQDGNTGWMDSLDPLFGDIADLWMETLVGDFGTDHWYQLDGYFDGSNAPWIMKQDRATPDQHIVIDRNLASNTKMATSYSDVPYNELAFKRGEKAYAGLSRTDPAAIWSYQGWQIVGWSTAEQAALLKGFVKSVPEEKFVVIDMSTNGAGEWKQWNNASFFGAKFVWTSLHNFGGTSGIKGDLSQANQIPFDGPSADAVIGTGATPEGIDQNPVYYEFLFDQNFRETPVENMHMHIVERSHRRYGISNPNEKVASAWSLLVDSAYAQDLSVQDGTGIPHLPGRSDWSFETDRFTPTLTLCKIYKSWDFLVQAAEESIDPGFRKEPFIYDLVNLGREILAQLSTPASLNLTDATSRQTLDRLEISNVGNFYIGLLNDTDNLVSTDKAFLLGPWIESAQRWGRSLNDCPSEVLIGKNCERFFEWNARTQITTWNPTGRQSEAIPGGPIDYASKHWGGLIRDYYGVRAELLVKQALKDESDGFALNSTELTQLYATHAYTWTTMVNKYPTTPVGDFLLVSRRILNKYKSWFDVCDSVVDAVFSTS